jgi:tRNA(Ile)-lysidine synthase
MFPLLYLVMTHVLNPAELSRRGSGCRKLIHENNGKLRYRTVLAMGASRTINRVHDKVLRYIRERRLMHAGGRVAVAVSGGADSVALLRVLLDLRDELGIVLAVAHFNHGLRGEESQADEAFVAELAKQHALEFFVGHADVRDYALTSKLSIEAAGRELRYRWLADLCAAQRFGAVATAHTLDDQAETVLLKFLRGAGTRGLAGIYSILELENHRIIRPLLSVSRDEVETYLECLGQEWREDETNLDRRFTRNRVRHDLLPLLEREFNPNIRALLSDAAEVSRAEEEYWQTITQQELSLRVKPEEESLAEGHRLSLDSFADLPLALQRRILKRFVEDACIAIDFDHVEKLLRCATGTLARAELPRGWLAERKHDCLKLRQLESATESPGYEYVLPVPGEVHISELGLTLRASTLAEEFAREAADPSLLDAALIGPQLSVRNWRPGDRFWPAHSRSQEKLKRLFAEKRIPAEQRASWPVVLLGTEILWVRGFPVARAYQWKGKGEAVSLELLQR